MNVEYADWCSTNSLAVAQKGKPAVYINNELDYNSANSMEIWNFVREYLKPKMDEDKFYNSLSDLIHGGLFFFDTMKEAEEFFILFNQEPVYASPLYAVLYDASGKILTENS